MARRMAVYDVEAAVDLEQVDELDGLASMEQVKVGDRSHLVTIWARERDFADARQELQSKLTPEPVLLWHGRARWRFERKPAGIAATGRIWPR